MSLLPNCTDNEVRQLIPSGTILLGYRGSIAHGTYVPQDQPDAIDDKDLLGVCIGPLDIYFGLRQFEQLEARLREWDCVTYELRKFVRLLEGANPNVLSLLWLDPNHYVIRHALGERLIANRHLFLTKKIYYSFTGYAYGQLKRIMHKEFAGYMGERRKELVLRHGYDTKHASHLIRLLRMGIEALRDGELHVHRHDAQDLLAIKQGKYALEDIKSMAQELFRRAEAAYDGSSLPKSPNHEAINTLVMDLLKDKFLVGIQKPVEPLEGSS